MNIIVQSCAIVYKYMNTIVDKCDRYSINVEPCAICIQAYKYVDIKWCMLALQCAYCTFIYMYSVLPLSI